LSSTQACRPQSPHRRQLRAPIAVLRTEGDERRGSTPHRIFGANIAASMVAVAAQIAILRRSLVCRSEGTLGAGIAARKPVCLADSEAQIQKSSRASGSAHGSRLVSRLT